MSTMQVAETGSAKPLHVTTPLEMITSSGPSLSAAPHQQAEDTSRMRNYLGRASMQVLLGVVVVGLLVFVGWLAVAAPHLRPDQVVPLPAHLPMHPAQLLPAHPRVVPSPTPA